MSNFSTLVDNAINVTEQAGDNRKTVNPDNIKSVVNARALGWNSYFFANSFDDRYKVSYRKIIEYLSTIKVTHNQGLYLHGGTGTGKTTIIKLIKQRLFNEFGRRCKYYKCNNLTFSFETCEKKKEQSFRDIGLIEYMSIRGTKHVLYANPYMCFDDLGSEKMSNKFADKCYIMEGIIDNRYEMFLKHKEVTLFTSNLAIEQLPYDDRTKSRLHEMCTEIEVKGKDSRLH